VLKSYSAAIFSLASLIVLLGGTYAVAQASNAELQRQIDSLERRLEQQGLLASREHKELENETQVTREKVAVLQREVIILSSSVGRIEGVGVTVFVGIILNVLASLKIGLDVRSLKNSKGGK